LKPDLKDLLLPLKGKRMILAFLLVKNAVLLKNFFLIKIIFFYLIINKNILKKIKKN